MKMKMNQYIKSLFVPVQLEKEVPDCPYSPYYTRWLLVKWYGKPFPLRLRVSFGPMREDINGVRKGVQLYAHYAPGCGCIVFLKRAVKAVIKWWKGKENRRSLSSIREELQRIIIRTEKMRKKYRDLRDS